MSFKELFIKGHIEQCTQNPQLTTLSYIVIGIIGVLAGLFLTWLYLYLSQFYRRHCWD